jgi:SAM-dependent methyltransferase
MKSRSCYSQPWRAQAIRQRLRILLLGMGLGFGAWAPTASAGDAPQWMRASVSAPLPIFDDKTDAVLLYSETTVHVLSEDKIKRAVREAYKILRPGGREYGYVVVPFNSHQKVNNLHGWCIPTQGKDYEVKDKDGVEAALPKVEGSELISDVKAKIIRIPAADPGNIIGYEYEIDEQPMVLQETWAFQWRAPVRESHYILQLPAGWEFRTSWLNFAEAKPAHASDQVEWVVSEVKGVQAEDEMPPMAGVAGQMVVSFFPASGAAINGFSNWQQMGAWYAFLTQGRT